MTKPVMLSNLSDVEFKEIQEVAKNQSETVNKIVKLMQEIKPDWNALMDACKGERGYQLLLAAKLQPEVEDDLIATGLIFLYHFVANQNGTVEYLKMKVPIPDNQNCFLRTKNNTIINSFGLFKRSHPLKTFTYQPMIHHSNRRDMISRLSQKVTDVLIPLPGIPLDIHGVAIKVDNYSSFGIYHDFGHAYNRDQIVFFYGWEAFKGQLEIATRLEDAKDKLPPYSVGFVDQINEKRPMVPLFKNGNPKQKDFVKFALDGASGLLIDGFFSPWNVNGSCSDLNEIIAHSLSIVNCAFHKFLTEIKRDQAKQVYDHDKLPPATLYKTLAYLRSKRCQ